MINNDSKVTTFSTITLLILKELRLERNIHQAQIAEMCNRTPSAWTKIETGRSPLTMEILFRVCTGLGVLSSTVLSAMERYATLLSQNGWAVISKDLDFNEDLLLKEAQDYYSSVGFRSRPIAQQWGYNSVLSGPIYNANGTVTPIAVFWFALDPSYKEQQLKSNAGHTAIY